MNKNKVSVIIPTKNRVKTLCRALNSVLTQSYNNTEIIIISDGSSDDTDKVIGTYDDSRIKFISSDISGGAAYARNIGLRASSGEYIAFLDDDDEWYPDKLDKQVRLFEILPASVGLIYTWMDYYDKGVKYRTYAPVSRGNVFIDMLDKQAIGGCPTIMIRREVIEKVGYFDESLPRGNDGDYWRRISKDFHVDFIPEVLVKVNVGHGHKRISEDMEGAIKSQLAKFEKFGDILDKYPVKEANIYAKIAFHYFELGDKYNTAGYLKKAFLAAPFAGSIYFCILKCFKYSLIKIFRRT